MMASMTDGQNQQAVTKALDALINEAQGVDKLLTPPGYPHLGLSILDAIYSLRSNYDTVVVPALQRYCTAVNLDWNNLDAATPEHGAQALSTTLQAWSVAERRDILTDHVAPGTTKRKFDLCVEIAKVLLENGVDGHQSLGLVLDESPGLEWKVRKLTGVGPAAWRYILNLSRVEKIKPDTMIMGWVGGFVEAPFSQAEAAQWLEKAARSLAATHPGLTVRQADHLVWRKQSKRPLTGDE